MNPWDFFKMSKNGFDPFKYIADQQVHKLIDQLSELRFPDNFATFFKQNNSSHEQHNETLNETIYETHHYIFIRIPIKDESKMNSIKIYYSLNKCIIDGYHPQNSPYTIILPAIVRKKGAKAIYKDQILEIKIPKNIDWQISEISVEKD